MSPGDRSRARATALAFVVGFVSAACSTREATELMLVVDGDLRSDARTGEPEIDEIVIRVFRPIGAEDAAVILDAGAALDAGVARDAGDRCSTEPQAYFADGQRYAQRFECAYALGDHPLPIRLGVVPSEGASGWVRFEVTARLRGQDVVQAVAHTAFEQNRLREVLVWLSSACRNVSCGEERTCRLGRCVDVESECSADPDDCVLDTPTPTPTSVVTGPSAFHTCAMRSDGALACWGDGAGAGTALDARTPIVATVEGVTAAALSSGATCVVIPGGSVQCWGWISDTREITPPYIVAGVSGATALAIGGTGGFRLHTCAILSGGALSCWGGNDYGQLGTGSTGTEYVPPATIAGLSGVIAVTAGAEHTCALLSDGSARCWGHNMRGQLGDGTTTDRAAPVAVASLSGATAIGAGGVYSCALVAGEVRCWGGNTLGMLGDGTTTDRSTPAPVAGISGASAIAVGATHACALVSGSVYCWGGNAQGELGDGTTTDRTTPVLVAGLDEVTAIATGSSHSCALRAGGDLRCWGHNEHGQLGDGTTIDRTTPVPVVW